MHRVSIKGDKIQPLSVLLAENQPTELVGYEQYHETQSNSSYTATDITYYPLSGQQFTLTKDALVSVTAWLKGYSNDGGANTVYTWEDSEITGGIVFQKWNINQWVDTDILPVNTKNVTYNVKYKLSAGTYRLKIMCTITLPDSHTVVKARTTCLEMTYTYAVNKTYIGTDGLCVMEDYRKYAYISLNDANYVVRMKGNCKMVSPNNIYQLCIDDSGIYKIVNGVRTYL